MSHCANCGAHACRGGALEHALEDCPSQFSGLQEEARAHYEEAENETIARHAAEVEAEGYGRLTRVEETLLFLKKCGYHRIGLAFCVGLWSEAHEMAMVLEYHGFEVCSIICKNGIHPKRGLGLRDEQTVSGCADEIMCNPIGQALLLNQEKTEFNLLLGLCVGHDTLVLKYLEAPASVLAVKDRVTGHNPLVPLYMAKGYYRKKLYPPQPTESDGK